MPGVEHGLVGMRSLVVFPGLQTLDLLVFTDNRLLDGFDDTPSTSFFPRPLDKAEAQVLEAADYHVPLALIPLPSPIKTFSFPGGISAQSYIPWSVRW